MLASALRATVPLTRDASRSSNVRPTGTESAGFGFAFGLAFRVTAVFFFGVLFFFFLDWPSTETSRSVMRRMARMATGRAPGNVIATKDTFPRRAQVAKLVQLNGVRPGALG